MTVNMTQVKEERYDESRIFYIRGVYTIAILIWIVLVTVLGLYKFDVLGWLILLLPIAIFLISIINAGSLTVEVDGEVFQGNYLSIGLLIIVPLLTCVHRSFGGDPISKSYFNGMLILAVILLLLSMIDVWVPPSYLSLVKHSRSIFQTMAIALIMLLLYVFYLAGPETTFL